MDRRLENCPLTIEAEPGENIVHATTRARKLSAETGKNVGFIFNDTPVVVGPIDDVEQVVAKWNDDRERQNEEWLATDEGKAYVAEREQTRATAQAAADNLIQQIPEAVQELSLILPIMAGLSESVLTGTRWDPAAVLAVLEAAGYVENEHVGHVPQSDLETNPLLVGRYVMGQCVSALRRGMPPHPVTAGFVESYFKALKKA